MIDVLNFARLMQCVLSQNGDGKTSNQTARIKQLEKRVESLQSQLKSQQ